MKPVTVILVYLQGNNKLVSTTPDDKGLRQILYTKDGIPCCCLEDVCEKYTMTQQELFGKKIRPKFNPEFITAEVPVVVRVPTDQRWSREIDF